MTRPWSSIPVFLLTAALVAGCSSVDQSAPAQVDPANLAARKAKAYELTAQGNLNAALVQWRILETLDGKDSDVVAKRKQVEARIGRLVQHHYQRGKRALAERDEKTAQTEFVLVLALEPSNGAARDYLRKLELDQVRRKRPRKDDYVDSVPPKPAVSVAAKSPAPEPAKLAEDQASAEPATHPTSKPEAQAEESGTELVKAAALVQEELTPEAASAAPASTQPLTSESLEQAKGLAQKGAYLDSIPLFLAHLDAFPQDEKAQDLLSVSHREVGISLYRTGKLRESVDHLEAMTSQGSRLDAEAVDILARAKDQLARETYESGVRIFRDDVQQAIAFWHETLRYDPGHAKARSYLAKAYKIQETLKALEQ